MSDHMKPCPFCGGKPKCRSEYFAEDKRTFTVWCTNCTALITKGGKSFYQTFRAGTDAWNQRAQEDQTDE